MWTTLSFSEGQDTVQSFSVPILGEEHEQRNDRLEIQSVIGLKLNLN